MYAIGGLLVVTAVSIGGSTAAGRLIDHVDRLILSERPGAALQFVNIPEPLLTLAAAELQSSLADLRTRPWTEAGLCEQMARRLATSPWIESLHSVRRTGDGRFEIRANYRVPVAAVQRASEFFLVDVQGVRLPGVYAFNAQWKVIRGVSAAPPAAASLWIGEDIKAGLKLLQLLTDEPYSGQLGGIDLDNFEGRSDPRGSHVELLTDRVGGRIRWGSAPGRELEENSITQKINLLRRNFADTGRADADHLVIDISTFPDRYSIPRELG